MPEEPLSPSARMSAAFSKLRDSAKEIGTPSTELSQAVHAIERALEHLHLCIACWTLLSEWTGPDQDEFRREYVGYIELHRQWRIAVRTSEGFDSRPDESHDITWAFDEAPLYLRMKAAEKLPELIEALVLTVEKTTARLKKRVAPAQELAQAVTSRAATPPPGPRHLATAMDSLAAAVAPKTAATPPPGPPTAMDSLSRAATPPPEAKGKAAWAPSPRPPRPLKV